MTPERWQKAKDIFDSALKLEPEHRTVFLAKACADDEALRREVESLIASHEKTGTFIDSPAYQAAAEFLVDRKAELKPGGTDHRIVRNHLVHQSRGHGRGLSGA
jgi:hypothetical protein